MTAPIEATEQPTAHAVGCSYVVGPTARCGAPPALIIQPITGISEERGAITCCYIHAPQLAVDFARGRAPVPASQILPTDVPTCEIIDSNGPCRYRASVAITAAQEGHEKFHVCCRGHVPELMVVLYAGFVEVLGQALRPAEQEAST